MTRVCELDSYDVMENPVNTRIEVVNSRDSELVLIRQYKDRGFKVVEVSDVFEETDQFLLTPLMVLRRLEAMAKRENIVVTGFSYYLRLWNNINVSDFYSRLKNHLDSNILSLILIVQSNVFLDSIFTNPKYSSGKIVLLTSTKESEPTDYSETVTVIDATFAPSSIIVGSYKELVRKICNPFSGDRRLYAVHDRGPKSAGLTPMILWPEDPSEILNTVWNYRDVVSPEVSNLLLKSCIENGESPTEYLESLFGKENMTSFRVLNRIYELSDNPVLPAVLEFLKRRMPVDSFISKALETYSGKGSFLHHYIVTAAIQCVGDKNQKALAEERMAAIGQCSGGSEESMVSEFVSKVKEFPEAICWLNCGKDSEKCDLIRRAGKFNLYGTFPKEVSELYPTLKDYIGQEFDYGDEVLSEYFLEYRVNKITNNVPEEFLEKVNKIRAKSIQVPTRREALQSYSDDLETAILVVDGLGAEYLPLLIRLLKGRGLNIERADTVKAELPTSTEFNPIQWNNKLRDIKGVDNTAHDGAEKHVNTSLEENIYATFQIIEKDVVNSVANNISKFKRIIITADHGLTRLAVRAYELGLSSTLDYEGDSWRFRDSTKDDREIPDNVDAVFNEQMNRHYWTIRNYNRFKKSSWNKYETHGGSSVEEMMVPFIVVVRDASDMVVPEKRVTKRFSGSQSSQIKEDDSLDELFG